ncbi:MAG TPA: GNAT family N-acetyltransferase [Streptosporangiaceae bacterium]|nr:GNAT family N-acetyltransferase [Streptosporangiaceae bacterium]
MLRPEYPIRTPRLLLRPFARGDLDALYEFHKLPEVNRFLYSEPKDRDQVSAMLADKAKSAVLREEGQALSLAAELAGSGQLVGDCTLFWRSRANQQGEVGFVFHPAHHGRGLATEATVELLRLGFDGLRLHRIFGRCDARNVASARVMERCGMRREAHLRENEYVKGEWTDEMVYAILRPEWAGRRPAAGRPGAAARG